MKLECPLQCSQNPATGPYPESDRTSPRFPSLNIILPSTSSSSKLHFTSGYPTEILYASPPLYTRHTPWPQDSHSLDHSNIFLLSFTH